MHGDGYGHGYINRSPSRLTCFSPKTNCPLQDWPGVDTVSIDTSTCHFGRCKVDELRIQSYTFGFEATHA